MIPTVVKRVEICAYLLPRNKGTPLLPGGQWAPTTTVFSFLTGNTGIN